MNKISINFLGIAIFMFSFISPSYAVYVLMDPTAKFSKIIQIGDMYPYESVCSRIMYGGVIKRVDGRYPTLEIFVNTSGGQTEEFQMDLKMFAMSDLRSLDSLISPNKKNKS